MAGKHLKEIVQDDPSIKISEVEVAKNLVEHWRQGVRMIPRIEVGQQSLTGIYLTKNRIRSFIEQVKLKKDQIS